MAGIYLHIPFCKQACHYCNFHFSTTYQKYRSRLIDALVKQLVEESMQHTKTIDTIYFGGGTPSLLFEIELLEILSTIKKKFQVAKQVEITLEANPDDITSEKSAMWFNAGVNRLSIGIQSFFQENLTSMNRAHSAEESLKAIDTVKKAGFKNYSVDLMFSLPDLTDEMWISNLNRIIELQVPHLSCYNLTIEEQTALSQLISKNKISPLSHDTSVRQFTITMDKLSAAGYQQYEISNYCLSGMQSKHNTAYWNQKDYTGIGPGAHSYLNNERSSNVANNMTYIKEIENGTFKKQVEFLTTENRFNEFILTRLRTKDGISLKELSSTFNIFFDECKLLIDSQIQKKTMILESGRVKLSRTGKFFADQIAMELFV
jgi:oxygen-independent coproporphyrinogen-3 oxidase